MNLTEHFTRAEFEKKDPMPPGVVPTYAALCALILEPIRAYTKQPIRITSGYRSPEHNAAVNGAKTSQTAPPSFGAST